MKWLKKIMRRRIPIFWVEIDYNGIPQYFPNVHPALEDDREFSRKLSDILAYLRDEYDLEDFL